MHWLSKTASLAIIAVGFGLSGISAAQAVPITGTTGLGLLGNVTVTPDGADLSGASTITFSGEAFTGSSTGNFSGATSGVSITNNTIDLANLGSYTFTSSIGTFTAVSSLVIGGNTLTSSIINLTVATNSQSLTIYEVGYFTPTGALSAYDENTASLIISLTESINQQDGSKSYSFSATLTTPADNPPSEVPEPASLTLLGVGLVGLGAMVRRRRRA